MEFTQSLQERAAGLGRTVVLPETGDDRILAAAGVIRDRGVAQVILLGDEDTVTAGLRDAGVDPAGITVIDSRNELVTESATPMEMGPTNSPAPPGISTMGRNASTVVKVEASNGTKRWRTAPPTASAGRCPCRTSAL